MTSDLAVFIILQFDENPVNGLWLLTCLKTEVEPCGSPNAPQDWKLVFKYH